MGSGGVEHQIIQDETFQRTPTTGAWECVVMIGAAGAVDPFIQVERRVHWT